MTNMKNTSDLRLGGCPFCGRQSCVAGACNRQQARNVALEPQKRGLFITFEGIDGAGKSSHIESAERVFLGLGHVVTLTREPGGTDLAEKLRALVLNDPMDPLTEALLMFAARRDHIARVIEPALARGEVVICDRFTDSTFAYQGGGRGFDLSVLTALESMVQRQPGKSEILQPDLTLWFDLPAEIAARRLAAARVPDRFESQPVEFFRAVSNGYEQRMRQDPMRFVRIDATKDREEVWRGVELSMITRLESTGSAVRTWRETPAS